MPSLCHFNPLLSEEKLHAVISLFILLRLPTLYFSAILINLMKQIRCQLTCKKNLPTSITTGLFLTGKVQKRLLGPQQVRKKKEKSPTNIDEVGWQEVAAGHTGGANEGVPVRGNSGPGLQWWVGGVCHHGHSGSYRIHECCWLMDGSNGGCADWLTPHPNVIRHFKLLRNPGGKSSLKMFLLKYMKVWLGQRKIPKSAAEVSLFSLCGVRLSNQSQVLKDRKKTNIKYEVEKRRPAGFKLSDNFQKHVLMSSRSNLLPVLRGYRERPKCNVSTLQGRYHRLHLLHLLHGMMRPGCCSRPQLRRHTEERRYKKCMRHTGGKKKKNTFKSVGGVWNDRDRHG